MDLDLRFPALSDLRRRARQRIPHFAWEYLDSATGTESVKHRNRAALDAVRLQPAVLDGDLTIDLATDLLGQRQSAPFGIAPLGMSGLIWPGAEAALARLAARQGFPFCLSTVATRLPEEIGPLAGDRGWFQLYPPRDPGIRADLLRRARAAGFRVLVLTVDVPAPSRRERQLRADLAFPPKKTPRMFMQAALRPRWALGTVRMGVPRLRLMEEYRKLDGNAPSTGHAGYLLRVNPDWDYVAALRDAWDGPLVLKGILRPDDALRARAAGADGIWVSNHAGRQFDGGPATIEVLPAIRAALGADFPVIADGGVDSGLDILRMLACGADFVMLGRAWHYALAALGPRGAAHLDHILCQDLIANLWQLGLTRPQDAKTRLWPAPAKPAP
ncbi:MAG: L-lactate dehydrogenase (cytochrome) [Rhodobacteraceae bacterium HLUCCA12]|nr:MAG: L-lactate dehydrogenase (cytochrome) [Rhodobacteraceae bacterium HLUCCA12]